MSTVIDSIVSAVSGCIRDSINDEIDALMQKEAKINLDGICGLDIEVWVGAPDFAKRVSLRKLVKDYIDDWGNDPEFVDYFPTMADELERAAKQFRNANKRFKKKNP